MPTAAQNVYAWWGDGDTEEKLMKLGLEIKHAYLDSVFQQTNGIMAVGRSIWSFFTWLLFKFCSLPYDLAMKMLGQKDWGNSVGQKTFFQLLLDPNKVGNLWHVVMWLVVASVILGSLMVLAKTAWAGVSMKEALSGMLGMAAAIVLFPTIAIIATEQTGNVVSFIASQGATEKQSSAWNIIDSNTINVERVLIPPKDDWSKENYESNLKKAFPFKEVNGQGSVALSGDEGTLKQSPGGSASRYEGLYGWNVPKASFDNNPLMFGKVLTYSTSVASDADAKEAVVNSYNSLLFGEYANYDEKFEAKDNSADNPSGHHGTLGVVKQASGLGKDIKNAWTSVMAKQTYAYSCSKLAISFGLLSCFVFSCSLVWRVAKASIEIFSGTFANGFRLIKSGTGITTRDIDEVFEPIKNFFLQTTGGMVAYLLGNAFINVMNTTVKNAWLGKDHNIAVSIFFSLFMLILSLFFVFMVDNAFEKMGIKGGMSSPFTDYLKANLASKAVSKVGKAVGDKFNPTKAGKIRREEKRNSKLKQDGKLSSLRAENNGLQATQDADHLANVKSQFENGGVSGAVAGVLNMASPSTLGAIARQKGADVKSVMKGNVTQKDMSVAANEQFARNHMGSSGKTAKFKPASAEDVGNIQSAYDRNKQIIAEAKSDPERKGSDFIQVMNDSGNMQRMSLDEAEKQQKLRRTMGKTVTDKNGKQSVKFTQASVNERRRHLVASHNASNPKKERMTTSERIDSEVKTIDMSHSAAERNVERESAQATDHSAHNNAMYEKHMQKARNEKRAKIHAETIRRRAEANKPRESSKPRSDADFKPGVDGVFNENIGRDKK
jgi:hypothetical protein